jgi:hypothetical protein
MRRRMMTFGDPSWVVKRLDGGARVWICIAWCFGWALRRALRGVL